MPFFSLVFRNADVGGERGFEAALAFLDFNASASPLDGERMKTKITTHKTAPTNKVRGFVRLSDRTGPMAVSFWSVSSIQSEAPEIAHVSIREHRRG